MITTDHSGSLVTATILGDFTLADIKEFEELVLFKTKTGGPIDLLVDLREMAGFTVDMALEEIKFSREHSGDFRRIAVLTESEWVTWSAWIEQLFVSADVEVFADEAEARAWLEENPEA